MESLMCNVALNEIKLTDNNVLSFGFLNTFNGRPFKKLLCHKVWKMNFETGMEEDDEFPCFITDVKIYRLENEQVKEAFDYFNYGYNSIPKSKEYNLIAIYGGDMDIDLLCSYIEMIEN